MNKLMMLAGVLLLAGCSNVEVKTSTTGLGDVEAEVREMLNSYHADVSRDGLMAEFKYLDTSAGFYWVPPGYTTALSRDSVDALIKAGAVSIKSVSNKFDTLHIVRINDETASYAGKVRSTITDGAGNTTTTLLQERGVIIKREDGWKLLSGHTNVLGQEVMVQ